MSKINLGIIGGGQLGSMLSMAAKKLNIKTTKISNYYKNNSICRIRYNCYVFIGSDGIEYNPLLLGYTENENETAVYSILSAMKYYGINSFGYLYEFSDNERQKYNNKLTMFNFINYF